VPKRKREVTKHAHQAKKVFKDFKEDTREVIH
jgi:hypothetical protein